MERLTSLTASVRPEPRLAIRENSLPPLFRLYNLASILMVPALCAYSLRPSFLRLGQSHHTRFPTQFYMVSCFFVKRLAGFPHAFGGNCHG